MMCGGGEVGFNLLALADAYDWTLSTYKEVFGEPVTPGVWFGKNSCRTKCKPVKCKVKTDKQLI